MALILAGCGGNRSGGGPRPDSGPALPPSGDCSRLCTRAAACFLDAELGGACPAACTEAVAPYGAPGAAVLAGCVACLEGHSCAEIASGACTDDCPSEALRPWEGPSSDAGVPSTENCATTWRQDGLRLDLQCDRASPTDSFHCQCFEDGVRSTSFDSLDLCGAALTDKAHQAAIGCRWPLESPCEQRWLQIESPPELGAPSTAYRVVCTPDLGSTDIGYACDCFEDDTVVASYASATFCQATHAERLDTAIAQCGWAFGAAGCERSWATGGGTSTFRCGPGERSSSTERNGDDLLYVPCQCVVDGVATSAFYTIAGTICTTTPAVQATVAERFCGWTLP